MARRVRIWTWDRGAQRVDMEDDARRIAPVLETVLLGGLWTQLQKFPPATVARVLPHVRLPPQTRRFVELWIEENRRKAA